MDWPQKGQKRDEVVTAVQVERERIILLLRFSNIRQMKYAQFVCY